MPKQRAIRTMDFAKARTEFSEENKRKRALLILELQRTVEGKGLFSRLIHVIAKKPFLVWN